jgi:hypothetical protein
LKTLMKLNSTQKAKRQSLRCSALKDNEFVLTESSIRKERMWRTGWLKWSSKWRFRSEACC